MTLIIKPHLPIRSYRSFQIKYVARTMPDVLPKGAHPMTKHVAVLPSQWRALAHDCRHGVQYVSFNPNWICREVVTVDVMRPQVGDTAAEAFVNEITPDGTARFGWFATLKISVRN